MHIPGLATRTECQQHIATFAQCLYLSGEYLVKIKVVPRCRQDACVSRQGNGWKWNAIFLVPDHHFCREVLGVCRATAIANYQYLVPRVECLNNGLSKFVYKQG